MNKSQIRLLKLLHNGDVEEILEQNDLNFQLNYLVEIRMIEIDDEEILLTQEGLEVLEMELNNEKNSEL